MVAGSWGEGKWGVAANGFSFWCDENVLEINIVVAHHYGCTNVTEFLTLKWLILCSFDLSREKIMAS